MVLTKQPSPLAQQITVIMIPISSVKLLKKEISKKKEEILKKNKLLAKLSK